VKDGDNGLLAVGPDQNLFSAGIMRILNDESLGITLGQRARDTIAERFSAGRMVENTIHMYEDVLQEMKKG